MIQSRTAYSLAFVAILFVFGCASPKISFLHTGHREDLAIGDQELKNLQFYISTQVLAKNISTPESQATAESVIIVAKDTPGLVTEIGPKWLRVSFEEGGSGARFITAGAERDDAYWLATEVEGQPGFRKVKELSEKILLHEGMRLRVVYGANARLLISTKDLEELIAQRRHLKGRVKGSD
jgi:hypothetical protein